MKIVFMGTPKIAADVLEKMVSSGYTPQLVVTQPDKEKNRGKKLLPSEVKELALELGLKVSQPTKVRDNEEFQEELRALNPDVAVVIAYGKILPKSILDIPKFGCINVHASLLPKLRGASPIQHAILNGDEKTGVTIMQMDEGMDTGDMLLKGELPIEGMNAEELSDALGVLGGELIVEALSELEKGGLKPEKQDEAFATYTRMIRKEDGKISFSEKTASEIERMTRAYYPWPGVSVIYEGAPMKLCKVSLADVAGAADTADVAAAGHVDVAGGEYQPGDVIKTDEKGIYVLTAEGVLLIEELQLPGKNKVDAAAFLRGHKLTKDSFKH